MDDVRVARLPSSQEKTIIIISFCTIAISRLQPTTVRGLLKVILSFCLPCQAQYPIQHRLVYSHFGCNATFLAVDPHSVRVGRTPSELHLFIAFCVGGELW